MDDRDVTGFRRVLHEWARRQLEEQSDHVGPFEIVHVELDHDLGSSMSSEETSVAIRFRHEGNCPAYLPCYLELSRVGPQRCLVEWWSMPDTKRTVEMVNELLAIAQSDVGPDPDVTLMPTSP
jgi:hypothetical protein